MAYTYDDTFRIHIVTDIATSSYSYRGNDRHIQQSNLSSSVFSGGHGGIDPLGLDADYPPV